MRNLVKAECHPEKNVKAKGLCSSCYKTSLKNQLVGSKCSNHPEKKAVAKSLCESCYNCKIRKEKICSIKSNCHPDRPHEAKGFCRACYHNNYERPTKATCHPTEVHHGFGLCAGCFKLRRTMIKRKLTQEDFNQLLKFQQNCCAICYRNFEDIVQSGIKKSPCIDHNHQTNEVRGLLCHNCNVGIGFLGENLEALSRAISYLQNPPFQEMKNA